MNERISPYEMEVLRALRFLQLYDDAEHDDRRPITLDMMRERVGHTTEFPKTKKEYSNVQNSFRSAVRAKWHNFINNDLRLLSALNSLKNQHLVRMNDVGGKTGYMLTSHGTSYVTQECCDLRFANPDFLFS